jgi:tryptophan halogenase
VQDRVGDTLAFAADFLGDEEKGRFVEAARFEQGRKAEPWSANVVAMGAAAAVLEPYHGLGLHLVQSAIERLLRLLPHDLPALPEQQEYNRETELELDRARDLVIATYALNGRVGDPMFEALRATDLPDELAAKLDLYRSRGRITLLDGDLLEEPEWALLLDEFGLRARRYDALVDSVPLDRLEAQFARMRELLIASVRPLPLHGDYLLGKRARAAA